MAEYRFDKTFLCPWCNRGFFLAEGQGEVTVSVKCPKCGRCYIGNLETMETKRTSACKTQKLDNMIR